MEWSADTGLPSQQQWAQLARPVPEKIVILVRFARTRIIIFSSASSTKCHIGAKCEIWQIKGYGRFGQNMVISEKKNKNKNKTKQKSSLLNAAKYYYFESCLWGTENCPLSSSPWTLYTFTSVSIFSQLFSIQVHALQDNSKLSELKNWPQFQKTTPITN